MCRNTNSHKNCLPCKMYKMYNPGRFCCHFAKRDNFGRQEVVFLVFDSIEIGATLEGKNFVSSGSKFSPLTVTYNKKGDNKLFHFGVSTL